MALDRTKGHKQREADTQPWDETGCNNGVAIILGTRGPEHIQTYLTWKHSNLCFKKYKNMVFPPKIFAQANKNGRSMTITTTYILPIRVASSFGSVW